MPQERVDEAPHASASGSAPVTLLSPPPAPGWDLPALQKVHRLLRAADVATSVGRVRVLDQLRQVSELVLYGDKRCQALVDYAADARVVRDVLGVLRASYTLQSQGRTNGRGDDGVVVGVLQTLSILAMNLGDEAVHRVVFRDAGALDWAVTGLQRALWARGDAGDAGDVVAHYVAFLKALSMRLDGRALGQYVVEVCRGQGQGQGQGPGHGPGHGQAVAVEVLRLPLYAQAARLAAHSDIQVRIAVRTVTLNVFAQCAASPALLAYVLGEGDDDAAGYLDSVAWMMAEQAMALDDALPRGAAPSPSSASAGHRVRAEEAFQEFLDLAAYVDDVLGLGVPPIREAMLRALSDRFLFPVLVQALRASAHFQAPGSGPLRATTALTLLAHVVESLSDAPLLDALVAGLLCPDDVALAVQAEVQGLAIQQLLERLLAVAHVEAEAAHANAPAGDGSSSGARSFFRSAVFAHLGPPVADGPAFAALCFVTAVQQSPVVSSGLKAASGVSQDASKQVQRVADEAKRRLGVLVKESAKGDALTPAPASDSTMPKRTHPDPDPEDGPASAPRARVQAAVVDRVATVLTAWPPPCVDTLCLAAWALGSAALNPASGDPGLGIGLGGSRRLNQLHEAFVARSEEVRTLARESVWVDRLGAIFLEDARAMGRPASTAKVIAASAFGRAFGVAQPGILWDQGPQVPGGSARRPADSMRDLRRAWAATRGLAALDRARQFSLAGTDGPAVAEAAADAMASASGAGVDAVLAFVVGAQVPDPSLLLDSLTCSISFVAGVEKRVHVVMRDDVVVLVEPSGKIVGIASVLASAASVDKAHPHWLHVFVRPTVTGIASGTWARFTDGKWTLSFPSADLAAQACNAIAKLADKRRAAHVAAIDAGLHILAHAWDTHSSAAPGLD